MKVLDDSIKWAKGLGEWNNFAYFLAGGVALYMAIWLTGRSIAGVSAVRSIPNYPTVYGSYSCPSCGVKDYVPRW